MEIPNLRYILAGPVSFSCFLFGILKKKEHSDKYLLLKRESDFSSRYTNYRLNPPHPSKTQSGFLECGFFFLLRNGAVFVARASVPPRRLNF